MKHIALCSSCGTRRYKTEAEALERTKKCIEHSLDCDAGWCEDVTGIAVAKITHRATAVNIRNRPDRELDEEEEFEFRDFEYICDYAMQPIGEGNDN